MSNKPNSFRKIEKQNKSLYYLILGQNLYDYLANNKLIDRKTNRFVAGNNYGF